jgi:hypothetical protein
MKKIQTDTLKGINKNVSQIVNGTKLGLTEMRANTTAGLTQAQELADGLKPVMQQLSSSAASSFTKLQTGTVESIKKTAADAGEGFNKMATGINDLFAEMNKLLTKGLDDSSKKVKDAFIAAVDKDIYDTIKKEGDKAAAEVQPRWKSVLKILLVIVVILVVALVVGPAVIGFVTAGAAALGAGAAAGTIGLIVGGAIVGAASGAVIQMGNNVIDNKPLFEGVGKAALIGAVSGALGGAGGALGQALTKGAQGLAPALIRFGVDMAFDVGGNIAVEAVQAYAEGRKMNWGDILTQSAISAGMGIGMANVGKIPKVGAKIEGIQGASMKFGEGLGAKVGAKIKPPKVEAPNVKAPDAPKIDTPEVDTPKTEIDSPTAKTDTDTKAPKTEGPEPKTKTDTDTPAPKADGDGAHAPKTEADGPGAKGAGDDGPAPKTDTDSPTAKTDGPETKTDTNPETKTPESENAANVAQRAQNDEGVVAKADTPDGHQVKALDDGHMAKCTKCAGVEKTYKNDIETDAKLKKEFEDIKKIPDAKERCKKLVEFDQKMKKQMVDDYRKVNPTSKLSDAEIKAYIDEGYRMNPDTGRFKHPDSGAEPTIKADYDGDPKTFKKEDFTPNDRKKLEARRQERQKARTARDKHAEGTDKFKEQQQKVVSASKDIGEMATDAAVKKEFGIKKPAYEGDGPRTFDRVYKTEEGDIIIVESKGGSAELGAKKGTGDYEGEILQQGTDAYMKQTLNEMANSPDPKAKKMANEILDMLDTPGGKDRVKYMHYQQKFDESGNLGPGVLKEFKL